MKLPRDLGGQDLAKLLRRYGYHVTRQTGSHLRLTSSTKGGEHHVTVSCEKALKIGTLDAILSDVASYLEMDKATLAEDLFGR